VIQEVHKDSMFGILIKDGQPHTEHRVV
jgi:hypothetical protein